MCQGFESESRAINAIENLKRADGEFINKSCPGKRPMGNECGECLVSNGKQEWCIQWYCDYRAEVETIRSAAVMSQDGVIYTVEPPARHHDCLRVIKEDGNRESPWIDSQGFLTSTGRFVNRVDAGVIALQAGQIPKLNWPPRLFSEDLW